MKHVTPSLMFLALLTACSSAPDPGSDGPPIDSDPQLPDEPPEDTGYPPEPIRIMGAAEAAHAVIRGVKEYHYFGGRGHLADFTGDGITDVAVYAASRASPGVYLFEGPLEGDIRADEAFAFFPWGSWGSGVGDLNGDGHADLMVVQGPILQTYEHQVYFGPFDPAAPPTQPHAVLRPAQTGTDVGSICDANGDGVDDLAISYGSHSLRFALGPLQPGLMGDDAITVTFAGEWNVASPAASRTFLCGQDMTGDGAPDLLIANGSSPYAVWLLQDPPWEGSLQIPDVGDPMAVQNGGAILQTPGDVTGDGYLDLFNGYDLVDGPLHLESQAFATFDINVGLSHMAPMGDLDGDGADDLVLGLPSHDQTAGEVFLLFGPIAPGGYEAADMDLILTAGSSSALMGETVFADEASLLWGVTAGGTTEHVQKQGHVYLFSGRPGL